MLKESLNPNYMVPHFKSALSGRLVMWMKVASFLLPRKENNFPNTKETYLFS